jgi:hypothetical protein
VLFFLARLTQSPFERAAALFAHRPRTHRRTGPERTAAPAPNAPPHRPRTHRALRAPPPARSCGQHGATALESAGANERPRPERLSSRTLARHLRTVSRWRSRLSSSDSRSRRGCRARQAALRLALYSSVARRLRSAARRRSALRCCQARLDASILACRSGVGRRGRPRRGEEGAFRALAREGGSLEGVEGVSPREGVEGVEGVSSREGVSQHIVPHERLANCKNGRRGAGTLFYPAIRRAFGIKERTRWSGY